MKKIFTILFLTLSVTLFGVGHYVKIGGGGAGTKVSPFASLSQLNAHTLVAGDSVYFNKGDVFYGTLNITASGNAISQIAFTSYGIGDAPVITGLTELTGWTNNGGNIWYKAVSASSKPNVISYDGINTPKGRWPEMPQAYLWPSNTLVPDSWSGNTQLTDATLGGLSSLLGVGAEIVIRSAAWIVETKNITGHSGNTLTFDATVYNPEPFNGYFIQNQIQCLTADGNWCYNTSNNRIYMYFGNNNPATHTIKISTLDNTVVCSGNYIIINGLTIEGGNQSNINLNGCIHTTIQNSTIRLGGNIGIDGYQGSWGSATVSYITITNNAIQDNNNNAIRFGSSQGYNVASYCNISYNTIERSGYILGMGGSTNIDYSAIAVLGNYNSIEYNNIHYTGYDAITFEGIATQVTHNYITWAVLNKADGAAIYSFRDYNLTPTKNISYNTILHCPTQYYSGDTYEREITANGIYMDGARYCNIHHNTLGYIEGRALLINCNEGTVVESNTFYDCAIGIILASDDQRSGGVRDGRARGHTVRYNTIVAKDPDDICLYMLSVSLPESDLLLYSAANTDSYDYGGGTGVINENVAAGAGINHNYYSKPISYTNYIKTWYNAYYWQGPPYTYKELTLTGFRNYLGIYDVNSTISTRTITDNTDDVELHFRYNATGSGQNYSLSTMMTDARNNEYSGIITLPAYSSIVLIGNGTVIDASAPPVLATLTTTSVSSITTTTAASGGNITSDGGATVTARGICWSTSTNPTIALSTKTLNGTGTGYFISSMTGLIEGTTYYVRAYATNSVGTAYGNQVSFNTVALGLASVITGVPSTVTMEGATLSGNVLNDGGSAVTERGVCWGLATNPTTAGSKMAVGTGTGTFYYALTGLTNATPYFVRAYAINTTGTSYGDNQTFTTGTEIVITKAIVKSGDKNIKSEDKIIKVTK